jgi:hypothetical protein
MTTDEYGERPARAVVEDGIPATSETPRPIPPGSEDEGEPAPLDHAQGVDEWGTTAREESLGESLRQRVAREEPERRTSGAGGFTLYEPGADEGLVDTEADAIAEIDPGLDDTLAPEELAMRVDEEPAGLNYDPDPGYVDDQELG